MVLQLWLQPATKWEPVFFIWTEREKMQLVSEAGADTTEKCFLSRKLGNRWENLFPLKDSWEKSCEGIKGWIFLLENEILAFVFLVA